LQPLDGGFSQQLLRFLEFSFTVVLSDLLGEEMRMDGELFT